MYLVEEKIDSDIFIDRFEIFDIYYRASEKTYFTWHHKLWITHQNEEQIINSYESEETKKGLMKIISKHKKSLNKVFSSNGSGGEKQITIRVSYDHYVKLKNTNVNITKLINTLLREYLENNA